MKKIVLLTILLACSVAIKAQTYIGGSMHIGNALTEREINIQWVDYIVNDVAITPLTTIEEKYETIGSLYIQIDPAVVEIEVPSAYKNSPPRKAKALEKISYEELAKIAANAAKEKGADAILGFSIEYEINYSGADTGFNLTDTYVRYIIKGTCVKKSTEQQ